MGGAVAALPCSVGNPCLSSTLLLQRVTGGPMAKHLIIAEKPSVAADVSRALGGFTRHDDYFESERYVLSSAVGHLPEIGMPEEEEVKRGKWTFAHLPAIPSKFALKPIEKSEEEIRALRQRGYWEVLASFGVATGEYAGRWFDESFKKREEDADARPERIWDEAAARSIVAKCGGKPGTVTEESKPSTQAAP